MGVSGRRLMGESLKIDECVDLDGIGKDITRPKWETQQAKPALVCGNGRVRTELKASSPFSFC